MLKYLITGGSGFIGTHLIQMLQARNDELLSIDIKPPKNLKQMSLWVKCDIKNKRELLRLVQQFRPTHVIHLAAKANLNGRVVADFPDNTLGTLNVTECVNDVDTVKRFIHTSTQYVVRPGVNPDSDDLLVPYTAYGESKAVAETIVRQQCKKCWTIIRPTNIWGPLHPFFPHELWRYLEKGYYFHPGFRPIKKYYGYVGNAVNQILSITHKEDITAQKVFYITDEPIDSYDWMNAFSLALRHKRAHRIPRVLWYVMALAGTTLERFSLRGPMDTDRYFRLTVNESVPHQKTLAIAGPPQYSLVDGVKLSIEWYCSTNARKTGEAVS